MKKSFKVAVVLSGCGVFDGSEIHETTLLLYYLDKKGVEVSYYAPDSSQYHVINHQKQSPEEGSSRNIRDESARIARGEVKALSDLNVNDIDSVIFPGGFGAAKNLSSFAVEGSDCTVDAEVARVIKEMSKQNKPQGFLCIAPVLIAGLINGVKVTIGSDDSTAAAIEKMGATHDVCSVEDICYDESNNIISTPAYMLANSISEIGPGIEKLVDKVYSVIEENYLVSV